MEGGGCMQGMIEYLKWRGDLSFDKAPQNEIDALILSEISYIPFENVVPSLSENKIVTLSEACDTFFKLHGEDFSLGAILPKEILILFKECAKSKRFSQVELWGYVSEISLESEKQFSAISVSCGDKITYVVYRGTDDTLVGWKEDLNMALFTPIPSQMRGVEYLDEIARKTKDKLIVTGHSKGGNIAVYSALMAKEKVQKRIQSVYSLDGPGFREDFVNSVKDRKITKQIITILPTKSVVGRIFDIIGDHKIVKSIDKGIQQHNAFTWEILGANFVFADRFEKPSDNFHELLKLWVAKMTQEQRHEFIESFYKIATSNDATTLTDITNQKMKFIVGLIKSEGSSKKAIFDAVFTLIKEKNAFGSAEKKANKEKKIAQKLENKKEKQETKKDTEE